MDKHKKHESLEDEEISINKHYEDSYELAKSYYERYGNLVTSQNKKIEYKKTELPQEDKGIDLGFHNKMKIIELCKENNIHSDKIVTNLMRIPVNELNAKLNFIKENKLEIVENDNLNPIFFMSNANLQATYNISLEDLIKNYSKEITL